jgi:hypothetical protein
MSIIIHLRDGTKREFLHQGRAGGSYTKSLHYEPGFVVIEDEWGKRTAIPTELIAEVESKPDRSW